MLLPTRCGNKLRYARSKARTASVESEEARLAVAEMAAQGYSLDTETESLQPSTKLYGKWRKILRRKKTWPSSGRGLRKRSGEYGKPTRRNQKISESQNRPIRRCRRLRSPYDNRSPTPLVRFFDMPAASQPAQTVAPQEPLLTLYDLFGFTEQERSQTLPKRRNRRTPARKPTGQPLMFDQPAPSEPQPAALVAEQPALSEQEDYDPEKLYASLNWEENPPINGFYQMMMGLTPERRAKLRQEPAERREQRAAQAPRAVSPRTQADTDPRAFGGEMLSHYREGTLAMDENGRVGYLRDLDALRPMFHPLSLSPTQRSKASLYIEIRDTYFHLYDNEAQAQTENPALREMLNRLYDDFTERFGRLNDKRNLDLIKMDARGTEMLSLGTLHRRQGPQSRYFRPSRSFQPQRDHPCRRCERGTGRQSEQIWAGRLGVHGFAHGSYAAADARRTERAHLLPIPHRPLRDRRQVHRRQRHRESRPGADLSESAPRRRGDTGVARSIAGGGPEAHCFR